MALDKTGYRARAKYLPMSPSKIRPIADMLRNKSYPEAIAILETLSYKKGAIFMKKVISSAAANALNLNNMLDEESLYVKELLVDGGPSQKRMWARARGRADMRLKRSSHIFVRLEAKEE